MNGVTADATPVASNFNYIIQCPDFLGNVGIGNANPQSALQVGAGAGSSSFPDGAGGTYRPQIMNSQTSGVAGMGVNVNDGTNNRRASLFVNQTDGVWGLGQSYTTGSIPFVITDASAERLRIDTHGNVGIATASPSLTLEVNGTAGGSSGWQTLSDERLKKNIVPINDALAIVEKLRGVRFDWREAKERSVGQELNLPVKTPQIGFVAQDVKSVLPEAVTARAGGLLSMQENKIVPVLVEAVKRLVAIETEDRRTIRSLQSQVAALKQVQGKSASANLDRRRNSRMARR